MFSYALLIIAEFLVARISLEQTFFRTEIQQSRPTRRENRVDLLDTYIYLYHGEKPQFK